MATKTKKTVNPQPNWPSKNPGKKSGRDRDNNSPKPKPKK